MPIRLIALDLDGTLLPRSKRLSGRTRAAVRGVVESGVRVVLATGKTLGLTARYAAELGLDSPLIALDGSLVLERQAGRILRDLRVPRARVGEALERVVGLGLLPFAAGADDRLLLHRGLSPVAEFLAVYGPDIVFTERFAADLGAEPHFLSLLGSPESVRRGRERLSPLDGDGLAVWSADFFVPDLAMLMVRPRADKGDALALVAAHSGVAREDVAAVGDWRNDAGMLRWAGLAVAMPDSDPEALSEADLVLPEGPEEDGLADFLANLPRPVATRP